MGSVTIHLILETENWKKSNKKFLTFRKAFCLLRDTE